jgi:hypothetical protein
MSSPARLLFVSMNRMLGLTGSSHLIAFPLIGWSFGRKRITCPGKIICSESCVSLRHRI